MKKILYISFLLLLSVQVKAQSGDDWLTIYTADSARNDFNAGRPRILVYGLRAIPVSGETNDSLCKAYHFTEYEAAGCEVTDAFLKGVEAYNKEMEKLLETVNGKGWMERYYADYAALRERQGKKSKSKKRK